MNYMIKKDFDISPYIKSMQLLYDGRIVKFTMPDEIFDECSYMVEYCRKFKDSPHSDLHYLQNVGSNGYQFFIPNFLIEDSFILPYLYMITSYVSGVSNLALRHCKTYYGAPIYDVWINYCYEGDINEVHTHTGIYSGIIFVDNDSTPTVFDGGNFEYVGQKKDVLLFFSDLSHQVDEKKSIRERTTIAFNMMYQDEL